jgi:hypothetical protein
MHDRIAHITLKQGTATQHWCAECREFHESELVTYAAADMPVADERTTATAALIAALAGLIFWPAGAAAIALAYRALPRRGRPRPLGSNRAARAATLGALESALLAAVLIIHAIHPLTTL